MKVYEFIYNGSLYESAAATISIHKTRKGAEMALDFHKQNAKREYDELWEEDEERQYQFGDDEYWGIRETELLD